MFNINHESKNPLENWQILLKTKKNLISVNFIFIHDPLNEEWKYSYEDWPAKGLNLSLKNRNPRN